MIGIAGPDQLAAGVEVVVIGMGGEPVFSPEENRALYQAALAFADSPLAALVAEASDLLARAGVQQPGRMLGPLLGAALDNAVRLGDAGLGGPVARGDDSSVAAHVAALGDASPGALKGYLALARLTADRDLASGTLLPADAERLLDVLGDP